MMNITFDFISMSTLYKSVSNRRRNQYKSIFNMVLISLISDSLYSLYMTHKNVIDAIWVLGYLDFSEIKTLKCKFFQICSIWSQIWVQIWDFRTQKSDKLGLSHRFIITWKFDGCFNSYFNFIWSAFEIENSIKFSI